MNNEPVLLVYVTTANADEAEKLARLAVEERLAACANILGPVKSIYRWQGTLEQNEEVAMLLKTTPAQFAGLEAIIKQHHSYEVPCIVAWPLSDGSESFLAWVRDNVC